MAARGLAVASFLRLCRNTGTVHRASSASAGTTIILLLIAGRKEWRGCQWHSSIFMQANRWGYKRYNRPCVRCERHQHTRLLLTSPSKLNRSFGSPTEPD
ncbi:hypothetical protein DL89DRAFT_168776 [Linderina pennispora]|uniref:Uncharacterized protein n=1 Tax=Linderina pennispora TaxID=61395 RepID=A0A1Y1W604_9FUNG|nr:uncharacterized protein DL89DRAFT_168776 [Linderina pennispora]ORX68957.1 hypothetical protein DL89DRAFT_168776 [Linderina pennispora]